MDAKTPQWPADKVQRRAISELLPYARNPRMHSPEQIKQLARAITEYGWTVPCIVDEEGTLIAGHGRVLAAEELGLEAVPVVVAKGWSEDRKRAYRIWDNQSVLLGTWNVELLSAELRELVSAGADMQLIGFPDAQLVQFLASTGGSDRERTDAENAVIAARLAGLKYAVIIECDSEQHQAKLLSKFEKQGYKCRALIS